MADHSSKFFFLIEDTKNLDLSYYNIDQVHTIIINPAKDFITVKTNLVNCTYKIQTKVPEFDGIYGSNFMYESLKTIGKQLPGTTSANLHPANLRAVRFVTKHWISVHLGEAITYFNPTHVVTIVPTNKTVLITLATGASYVCNILDTNFYGSSE
jgi:hypothetical protein